MVTTPQDLDRIARLGLRRRDRVLWLDGWSPFEREPLPAREEPAIVNRFTSSLQDWMMQA